VIRTALIVLSDRAASGERADASLPAMRERLDGRFAIVRERVLADDPAALQAELIDLADSGAADLVLTSGGTGLAPRDRTPQATAPVLDYEVPGIAEAIRAASLRIVPTAMLSRALAGVRHRTLIVNLPGSPKAVREALDVVTPVLEHAIRQLTGIANEHPEIG
jgi:molybdopterin adenylyltransferase